MNIKIINLLKTLPEPYASKALKNYDPGFYQQGVPIENLNDAIGWAFDWETAPEGEGYWMILRKHLEDGVPLPTVTSEDAKQWLRNEKSDGGPLYATDQQWSFIWQYMADFAHAYHQEQQKKRAAGFVFFIDEVRELIAQYRNKEITLSKLTEVLNEKATGVDSMELIKRSLEKKPWVAPTVEELGRLSDEQVELRKKAFNKKHAEQIENHSSDSLRYACFSMDDVFREIPGLHLHSVLESFTSWLNTRADVYATDRAKKVLETFSKEYELTVGGSLMMRIRINESGVEVVGAIDGYGHSVLDQISVEENTYPKNAGE